jgi:hypothetical protein
MGKFLLKLAVNRPLKRYPSVLNGDLNFVIGNANVALELLNGIPGNFRISSLPERFHRNVVGHRFHSVDMLSPLSAASLSQKVGTKPESVTTLSLTATAISFSELILGSHFSSLSPIFARNY